MNNLIDYSKYKISFTSDFDKVWLQLKNARDDKSRKTVTKVYDIIDSLLSGEDVETKYHAHHPRNDTDVWDIHIEPQGRTTGDLVLLYRINNMSIELDLRLQNIVKHNNQELYKKSSPKYADRQALYKFDIIKDKYSDSQIDYCENCYNYIISDYRVFQRNKEERKKFTESLIDKYIQENSMPDSLTRDQLIEILYYIESDKKNHIFGSIQFNDGPKETGQITKFEEQQILSAFDYLGVDIIDAYVETIKDDFGDTYEDMYVVAEVNDINTLSTLNNNLSSILSAYDIQFSYTPNGYGSWGQTYDFYHYFVE